MDLEIHGLYFEKLELILESRAADIKSPAFRNPPSTFRIHFPAFRDPLPDFQNPYHGFQDPLTAFQNPLSGWILKAGSSC